MAEPITWDPTFPVSSRNHPPERAPLRPNQRVACDFALDHKRCGLFLPLGTGKSLTTLETLYELNPACHVLIVGPKPVMRSTWVDEIEKWGYPFRTKSLMTGPRGGTLTRAKRLELYEQVFSDPPTVYFINRELVEDLVGSMPRDHGCIVWPFPYVVLDEAQAFKGYSSKRFLALKSVSPAIDRLIELTGTPSPNGLMDLWSLIYLIDGGQRLGRNITTYRRWFFDQHDLSNSRGKFYTIKRGAAPIIQQRIADVVMSVDGIQATLPPVTYDDRVIDLSPDEFKLYKQLERNLVIEFADETSVEAANTAVLQTRLSQIASGTLYVEEDGIRTYKVIHERKLEECLRIIEDAGSPVLVAYRFQSDRDELMRYLSENRIDARVFDGSREMVAAWNRREIPVMLIQPASAGAGLNLQHGGHTLVWYSVPWNLEHYLQTNARINRSGQTEPVFIHHLLANVQVERRVMRAIEEKDRTETSLLEAVCAEVPDLADDVMTAKERREAYEREHPDQTKSKKGGTDE